MVRLRMKSLGRRHRPFFRICAMDSRTPRDGRSIEELGHYDPLSSNAETQTVLNVDRIRYWLGVGAQPSHKVQALLKKHGVKKPAPGEPWQLPEPAAALVPEAAPGARGGRAGARGGRAGARGGRAGARGGRAGARGGRAAALLSGSGPPWPCRRSASMC